MQCEGMLRSVWQLSKQAVGLLKVIWAKSHIHACKPGARKAQMGRHLAENLC